MKLLKSVKNGCVIFTVITLIMYTTGALLSDNESSFIPNIRHIWLFFAFSILLSIANEVLKSDKLSIAARLGIHFAASLAIYFVTIVLCGGYIKNGGQTIVALTLFAVLYVLFAILYMIFAPKKEKKAEKYEKMF